MGLPGAGPAILFVIATAAEAIVGLYTAAWAAHCFLVVLEQTSAGRDEVEWPDDLVIEWLWKPFFFAWLIALWVVPVWGGVSLVAAVLERPLVGLYPAMALVVWLLFPISLLSCLHAQSRLTVLHWMIVRRMLKNGGALLLYYLVTGVLVLGAAALVALALTSPSWGFLPLAALVVSAVLLIDARLLGRIAWLVGHCTPEKTKPGRKKKARPIIQGVAVADPWEADAGSNEAASATGQLEQPSTPHAAAEPGDLPPSLFAPDEPPPRPRQPSHPTYLDEYGEIDLQPLAPTPHRPRDDEEDWEGREPYRMQDTAGKRKPRRTPDTAAALPVEGYALQPQEPAPRSPVPLDGYDPIGLARLPHAEKDSEASSVSRFEERLAQRYEPPKPPSWPMWQGIYHFPWYRSSVRAWIYLTILTLTLGTIVRVQIIFWPFG